MSIPKMLIENGKTKFDLTEVADQESLYALTNRLMEIPNLSFEELRNTAGDVGTPLEFKIAAKIVESKKFLLSNKQGVTLGVVFAMWGEQNRLLPKTTDNPNGEDLLRVKLQQLDWITRDSGITWTLYAVDDGCPHGSGKIAEEIISNDHLNEHAKVLYLSEAIPSEHGPLAGLKSVNDSRKGGAIILGCLEAINDGAEVIICTDADSSVHLGQIGLLLQKFIINRTSVVLGNRKDPNSVLVKQETRWGIGIKLLRHMQRMVGQAIFSNGILDTQAAFKLYHRDILQKIIQNPTVYDFSFDTDWILAAIVMDAPFEQIPFAFIDSFAESASITQGPMTTWKILLKGLVKQVQKYGLSHNKAMERVIHEEILTSADLDILIHHLPPELVNVEDRDLGNPDIMSPEAVRAWIQHRKAAH